jgi:hypothetical protein
VVVEFEVPFDHFLLPDGEVNLWLEGRTWLVAQPIGELSGPRGPHRRGLVVRLALRLARTPDWKRAHMIEVRWVSRAAVRGGLRAPRQLTLRCALPQAREVSR